MDSDDEKQEYAVSYDQLKQLGPREREGLELLNAINSGEGMAAALRKSGQMRIDPVDRFKILCGIYYNQLGDDQAFIVNWGIIIKKIRLIKWIQFKNPIGFIMGARTIDKKRLVDKTRLDFACSDFKDTMKTENISKEDILRYGRYWEMLLK